MLFQLMVVVVVVVLFVCLFVPQIKIGNHLKLFILFKEFSKTQQSPFAQLLSDVSCEACGDGYSSPHCIEKATEARSDTAGWDQGTDWDQALTQRGATAGVAQLAR